MDAFNISDLRAAARKRLPRGIFEFVDRGCEDDDAVRHNREAWQRIRFAPRSLVDVSGRTLQTSFFGRPSTLPIASAPTGAAGLLWVDGELEVAKSAAKAGIPFTLSTASLTSMEAVADEVKGTLWFQLYLWSERSLSHELVKRAKAAGYHALLVTVDTVVQPNREYNRRNGFALPFRLGRRNAVDMLTHPRWLASVMGRYLLRGGMPQFENYPAQLRTSMTGRTASGKPRGLPQTDSLSWSDLAALRRLWDGPLVVKGILRPDDAERAVAAGVDGIVVSNHGGRNLDASMAPVEALPRIAERVGSRVEIFVDGGVQRGSDVMKALALGAKGVMLGRAPLWGLAAAGGPGVDFVWTTMRDEMLRVMAYLGCATVGDVAAELLWPARAGACNASLAHEQTRLQPHSAELS
jgi:L-lactate dehydrogenase (cytochrome)/(S)-mandelate dehydrogenase